MGICVSCRRRDRKAPEKRSVGLGAGGPAKGPAAAELLPRRVGHLPAMANSISNIKMTNPIKGIVSKRRKRYIKDGFNLDLAYITDRLIAMGFPAEKLEGVYRNHIDEVYRFLEQMHKDHYKIYNLCSERSYDSSKFQGRVERYAFEDHTPPNMELIQPFCEDVHKWLNEDPRNVAAVHCKAGKGRTGTMVCCYLLYSGQKATADEALQFYGTKRAHDNKGVTIPSQRRYVEYYAALVRSGLQYTATRVYIRELVMCPPPMLNGGQCTLELTVSQAQPPFKTPTGCHEVRKHARAVRVCLTHCTPLHGDVRVDVYTKPKMMMRKEKLFHFWFNTFFLAAGVGGTQVPPPADSPNQETYKLTLNKWQLDDAHKDKQHKLYSPDFKVELIVQKQPSSSTFSSHPPRAASPPSSSASDCSEPALDEHWDSGEQAPPTRPRPHAGPAHNALDLDHRAKPKLNAKLATLDQQWDSGEQAPPTRPRPQAGPAPDALELDHRTKNKLNTKLATLDQQWDSGEHQAPPTRPRPYAGPAHDALNLDHRNKPRLNTKLALDEQWDSGEHQAPPTRLRPQAGPAPDALELDHRAKTKLNTKLALDEQWDSGEQAPPTRPRPQAGSAPDALNLDHRTKPKLATLDGQCSYKRDCRMRLVDDRLKELVYQINDPVGNPVCSKTDPAALCGHKQNCNLKPCADFADLAHNSRTQSPTEAMDSDRPQSPSKEPIEMLTEPSYKIDIDKHPEFFQGDVFTDDEFRRTVFQTDLALDQNYIRLNNPATKHPWDPNFKDDHEKCSEDHMFFDFSGNRSSKKDSKQSPDKKNKSYITDPSFKKSKSPKNMYKSYQTYPEPDSQSSMMHDKFDDKLQMSCPSDMFLKADKTFSPNFKTDSKNYIKFTCMPPNRALAECNYKAGEPYSLLPDENKDQPSPDSEDFKQEFSEQNRALIEPCCKADKATIKPNYSLVPPDQAENRTLSKPRLSLTDVRASWKEFSGMFSDTRKKRDNKE